jgi:predicted dehydrogenase
METVRTVIVGCGKVGQIHAEALRSLPESLFVGVCDAQFDRAQSFGSRYGVQAFDSVPQMLSRSGAEALMVCTPHPQHEQPCIEAATAGVHVLVEKPMASSLAACDAMLRAAREGG